jgi:hypothetical protein
MTTSDPDPGDDILSIMQGATEKARAEAEKEHHQTQASISVKSSGYEPRCKCCNLKGHEEYDRALLTGELNDTDYSKIANCSSKSVARHRNHIAKEIALSSEAELIINADSLLDQLTKARQKTLDLLDMAVEAADTRVYGAPSQYLGEIRQQIKLMGELQGKLPSQPLTQVNIYGSKEWDKVGDILARALAGYPELRTTIAGELLALAKGAT